MITLALRVYHRPVLVKEVLEGLNVQAGGAFVDATVSEGGHALAILEAAAPGGRLLGLDADPQALETARERLSLYKDTVALVHSNFAHLQKVAEENGLRSVDGVVFDLGLSTLQLEGEGRGFSFAAEEPLDSRFDPSQELTAHHIVNTWSQEDLAQVIATYGEEPRATRIAQAIVRHRPLTTARALAQVVEQASGYRRGRTHPATRTFMGLRIAVNEELEALKAALPQALSLLRPGGRLVVLAYHSLEDRIVKEFMRRESRDCLCPPSVPVCQCGHKATLCLINKRVIVPSPEEIRENPRSRSARMRVAQRL